jgi:hypothetical protein
MGLESEIERLFHEAQDWDMELVASSALPTSHSNTTGYPGGSNASVSCVKMGGGGRIPSAMDQEKNQFRLSLDKDYFLVDRLVYYAVSEEDAREIGDKRLEGLKHHHEENYKAYLDGVSAAVETANANPKRAKHVLEHAFEHLKDEGPNYPITIKLYDFDLPEDEEKPSTALKVVITFQNCDYILNDRRDQAEALNKAGDLMIPLPGLAARWPREIELRTEQGKEGNIYIRADLCKEAGGTPDHLGVREDKIKS